MRMTTIAMGLLMLPQLAHARSVGWFAKGAATVEITEKVDLPLYRGVSFEHRPLVRLEHPVDGDVRWALAVVDLGQGWTKIGREAATALGIAPESTNISGQWTQVATVDELRLGSVVLRDLRVEIVSGDEVVLGLGAVDEIASAILPSAGVVRLVPASQGEALVRSVGKAVPLYRQSRRKYKDNGTSVRGNGFSFAMDGAISGRDGRVAIETSAARSRVTPSFPGTAKRRSGGVTYHRARGRLGDFELTDTWFVKDESLSDPSSEFVGSLGYDELYLLDLAVHPAMGIASAAKVEDPQWTPATSVVLELAKARHQAAGLSTEAKGAEPPPRMTFGDGEANPEGDEGDPRVMGLERALANALWNAGELDAAMPHFLKAAEAAGDRCGPQMELGLKRLAWSGSMQEQDFIIELIRQPLREAGTLWDRWAALGPETREAIRGFKEVPSGTFKIPQDRRCLTAWGNLMAAYIAQGNTTESSKIYTAHHGTDPLVAFAQGLSLLEQGQAGTAEIPIRAAVNDFGTVDETPVFRLGLARAQALQNKMEPVYALVDELSALDTDFPLTTALMAMEWGTIADPEAGRSALVRRMLKQDPYWVPAQLLAVWLELEEADPALAGAELVRLEARLAGDPSNKAQAAVLMALQGEGKAARKALVALRDSAPPTPDLFAAMAMVAHIRGKNERLDEVRKELRLRWPTLPFDDLSLPLVDAVAPPASEARMEEAPLEE